MLYNSHFANKYKSGIISLTINTTERWIPYHRYNNGEYLLGEEERFKTEDVIKLLKPNTHYIHTNAQAKDQIYFYWIPFDLLK